MNHLGIDIGGTSTEICLFASDPAPIPELKLIKQHTLPTKKNNAVDFYRALVAEIHAFAGDAMQTIGIGQPGLFLNTGTVAAHTAVYLFDDPDAERDIDVLECFRQAWSDATPSPIPKLAFHNDAIAQMAAVIGAIDRENPVQNGASITFLCPGTGLGGGVMRKRSDGSFEVVSDGHLSQLTLPDIPIQTRIPIMINWKNYQLPHACDPSIQAESLISGTGLANMMASADTFAKSLSMAPIFSSLMPEPLDAKAIANLVSDTADQQKYVAFFVFNDLLTFSGSCLGHLMLAIHQGKLTKNQTRFQWSHQDIAIIRDCDRFIIAGNMMTSKSGETMMDACRARLKKSRFTPVIDQPTGSSSIAGAKGALILALMDTQP